jgi:hypothetical protein
VNLSRGETERTGAYTCANASPSHHVGKRSKLRRARPVSCPRLCFDARNGRILPQTPLSFSLGLGLHPASHRRCWLVLAGAGWCWLVLGGHLGGRRAQVERLRGGEHLRHLRCRLALRLLLQLLERLAAGLALRACARVKGAGVGEPRGAHTATPARVESSKASPRHRPREDGLTLQTLQDPVLLPPWVCFQDGGFSKHER